MESSWLRWKGRLGSLKVVALLGIILGFSGLVWSAMELNTARSNPSEPQPVTLAQLVNGDVGRSSYVTVEGYAVYQSGYEETDHGIRTAVYYYLFDMNGGYAVLIKADRMNLDERVDGPVSLTGMTAFPSSSDLHAIISEDVEYFADAGIRTTPDVYIRENARPSSAWVMALLVVASSAVGLASVTIMTFPSLVFVPAQAQPGGVAEQGGVTQGVRATGRFQTLKRLRPSVEVGRRWRKFTTAVANVIPLENQRVMIYIHHIFRYSGIKVSDTHWGVTFDPTNVVSVQSGKILRFRDRWAVRFVHRQRRDRPEDLIVSFARAEDQADFVALLRGADFIIDDVGIA